MPINNTLLVIIFIFILGSIFGSFLYCVSYRYINKLSIIKGRSRCDYCGHELKVVDLIPIISFIINKGRCRYCKEKIDISYLISEAMTAICFILIYIRYGLSINTLMYLILISLMIIISFIDFNTYIIPDIFIVLGFINMLIFKDNKLNSLINGVIIGLFLFVMRLIMNRVFNKESMGLGDIKLFLMLGTYLSLYNNLVSLLLSCLIGVIFVVAMRKKEFPFGPSICIAYTIVIILFK